MATKYIYIFGIVCIIPYVSGSNTTNLTDNKVISFPDDVQYVGPGFKQTWMWRRDTGIWGVKFLQVTLGDGDLLICSDNRNQFIYSENMNAPRWDTNGPLLNITFKSGRSNTTERGFKIDVRHGQDTFHLNTVFRGLKPTLKEEKPDLHLILPLLVAIVVIVFLLFLAVLTLFVCHRRRRRRQQVSLTVNVNSGIRRDSGVRYSRKPSTQSQLEEPQSPTRKTSKLSRSNSDRSWMMRAELMATSVPATPSSDSCNGGGRVHARPNWYIPTDEVSRHQGQKLSKLALEGKVHYGRGNDLFRQRLTTLERVSEYTAMATVPAPPKKLSQDEGYLEMMSHSASPPSYLNSAVFAEAWTDKGSTPIGSCADGCQNITVTGSIAMP